jgi:hypothetical protein
MKRKLNSHIMFLIRPLLFAIAGCIVEELAKVIKQLGDIFIGYLYIGGVSIGIFSFLGVLRDYSI